MSVSHSPTLMAELPTRAAPPPVPRSAPDPDGYRALGAAVLRLAWLDAQSPRPTRHQEALAFWRNHAGSLTFWCEVLGLPDAVVQRHAAVVLDTARSLDACGRQLRLW